MRFLTARFPGVVVVTLLGLAALLGAAPLAHAADAHPGGEASLVLPDLDSVSFLGGVAGGRLLMGGIVVCLLGLTFGLIIFNHLKHLPVHKSMREISDLIYETSKDLPLTQGKFILKLEVFIGSIMVLYFGVLRHFEASKVVKPPAVQPDRNRPEATGWPGSASDQHLRQPREPPLPA